MSFWTMTADDMFPDVTLCDAHALEATNIAVTMMGHQPYQTMGEAALDLEATFAVFGLGMPAPSFIETDDGECDECQHPSGVVVFVTGEEA